MNPNSNAVEYNNKGNINILDRWAHILINNISTDLVIGEVIRDEMDNPSDILCLYYNKALGIKGSNKFLNQYLTEAITDIKYESINWLNFYDQAIKEDKPVRIRAYFKNSHRWHDIRVFGLEKNHFLAEFQDITEIKQSNEILRKSEYNLRNILNDMDGGVVVKKLIFNNKGDIIDWTYEEYNSTFTEMAGFTKEISIRGRRGSDLLPESGLSERLFILNRIRGMGSHNRMHYRHPISHLDLKASIIVRDDFAIMTLVNIEDFTTNGIDSLEINTRYAEIIETISDGILVLDHEYRCTYANKQIEATLGKPVGDIINNIFWDVFPNIIGTQMDEEIRRSVEERLSTHLVERVSKDMWLDVRCIPSANEVIIQFRDVTEKSRREELSAVIRRINEIALSNPCFDEVMNSTLEELSNILKADNILLSLLDENDLIVKYCDGQIPVKSEMRFNNKQCRAAYLAIKNKRSIIVPNVDVDRRVDAEFCRRNMTMAFAIIPLISNGKSIGIILISFVKPRKFSTQEIEFIEKLATTLSLTIENARLFNSLAENETKYRNLFESIRERLYIGHVVENDEGEIVDWIIDDMNPAAISSLKELGVEGIKGKAISGIEDEDAMNYYRTMMEAARESDKFICFEHQDSRKRDYITSLSLSGKTFIAAQRDITDIKETQRRVEDERSRLQAIFDTAPVGIAFAEAPSGKYLYASKGLWEIFKLKPRDISSLDDYSSLICLSSDDRPLDPEEYFMTRALRGEYIWNQILPIVKGDGTRGFISVNAAPVKDSAGEITAAVAIGTDVTDLMHIQKELRRSNDELGQFAYIASHDLQEPIRSIMTNLTILERRHGKELNDDDVKGYISDSIRQAKGMRELISDLLQYSRANSAEMQFDMVDLNSIANSVIDTLQNTIIKKQAKITVNRLPTVCGNKMQLTQILQNLISNAIKFQDSDLPIVEVSALQNPREHIIFVRDNGIGIDPEHIDELFQMFNRLHPKHEYEGTGIGLAICKKVIEKHGGRIWVESLPGKGSTFYFSLPKIRRSCRQ